MSTVAGSVEQIVFRNDENGFCVARVREADSDNRGLPVTVVGTMPTIHSGEMIRLSGEWETHPAHGRNFKVEAYEQELPKGAADIERYLGSGAISGIGPVTATRAMQQFGDRIFEILDEEPELLRSVKGVSPRRLSTIKESWERQKNRRGLMMFLQANGLSISFATRIEEVYGSRAMSVIESDPYQLAHDIHGVGFRTADSLARRLGISRDSVSRQLAGLRHVLSEAADDGHVALPKDELLERTSRLLETPSQTLEPALLESARRRDTVVDDDSVYLAAFFTAEAGAADFLAKLRDAPSPLKLDRRFDPHEAVCKAGERQGLELAEKQVLAAEQALREKVSILTGGPGTGKTSTLRTLIAALTSAEVSFCLCAPTGRAAKRAAETTGHPASTIHRLLEYQPKANMFRYDQDDPLPYDFIIVDEVSMLDIVLFYHLLKGIAAESQLLLVGDADQLPSVGAGNVLQDLLNSEAIPTVRLTELFRQAKGSQIVFAAHAVNRGEVPQIGNSIEHDLFFIEVNDERSAVSVIKRLVGERIPDRFGLDPTDDVQVMSPMHNGQAGVSALNLELQALLNPAKPDSTQIHRGSKTFRLADKVMQIRNNYDKDVYNGDVGKVVAIEEEGPSLAVAFPTGTGTIEVEYEGKGLDELVLAYATSVHKAQGSEYPCIVMPLVRQHFILLQRNLLYTAITRARQLCVLVGSMEAFEIAVKTDHRQRRHTNLARRVREDGREVSS
jgi:exodeoxyribonuclease V alpha subunit